jgi:hypothetical protein
MTTVLRRVTEHDFLVKLGDFAAVVPPVAVDLPSSSGTLDALCDAEACPSRTPRSAASNINEVRIRISQCVCKRPRLDAV